VYAAAPDEGLLSDGTVVLSSAPQYPERPVARTNRTTRRAVTYRRLGLPGSSVLVQRFVGGAQTDFDAPESRELDGFRVRLESVGTAGQVDATCAVYGTRTLAAHEPWSHVTLLFSGTAVVSFTGTQTALVATGSVVPAGAQTVSLAATAPSGVTQTGPEIFHELRVDATGATLDGRRFDFSGLLALSGLPGLSGLPALPTIARVEARRVLGVVASDTVWSGRFAESESGTSPVIDSAMLSDLVAAAAVSRADPAFSLAVREAYVYAGDDFTVVATSTNGTDLAMYAAVSEPPYKSRSESTRTSVEFTYTCGAAPFAIGITIGPTTASVASPRVVGAPVVIGGTLVVGAESTLVVRAASAPTSALNASILSRRDGPEGTFELDVVATARDVELVFDRVRVAVAAYDPPTVTLLPVVEPQIARDTATFAFRATVVPMVPGVRVVGLDASTVAERGARPFFPVSSRTATARVAVYAHGIFQPIATVAATTATYTAPVSTASVASSKAVRGVPTEVAYVTDVPRGTVIVSAVATGCVLVAVPVLASLTRITAKILCPTTSTTSASSSGAGTVTVALVGPDGAAFDVVLPVESEPAAAVLPAPAQPAPIVDGILAGTATYTRGTLAVVSTRPPAAASVARAWRLSPEIAAGPAATTSPYTYTEIVTAPATSARTVELGHATVRFDGPTLTISAASTRSVTMAPGEHHVCVVVTPTETSGYLDGVRFAGLAVEAARGVVPSSAVRGAAHTGSFFATPSSAARLVRARADAPTLLDRFLVGATLAASPTGFVGTLALGEQGDFAVCVSFPSTGETAVVAVTAVP
jgi:hypothetical protein